MQCAIVPNIDYNIIYNNLSLDDVRLGSPHELDVTQQVKKFHSNLFLSHFKYHLLNFKTCYLYHNLNTLIGNNMFMYILEKRIKINVCIYKIRIGT